MITGTYIAPNKITLPELTRQMLKDDLNMNYIKESTYSRHIETLKRIEADPYMKTTPIQKLSYTGVKEYLLNASPGIVLQSTIKIGAGLKYGYFNNNTLPTPTRSGYTFKGWYTESSGGTKITANTIVQNGNNHTLYAQWIKNGSSASIQPSEYALIPDMPKKAFTKGEK